MPATPSRISSRSDTAQTATTMATCERWMPWRRTKAFCAPMATMRDNPAERPETKGKITIPRQVPAEDETS